MNLVIDYEDINFTIDTLRRCLDVYNTLSNTNQTDKLLEVLYTQRNLHSLTRHYYYWTPDYVSWKQFTYLRDILYLPQRVSYEQVRNTEEISLNKIKTDTQVMLSILLKLPRADYHTNKIVFYVNHENVNQAIKDSINRTIRYKISNNYIDRINQQIDVLEQIINLITGEDEMIALEGSTQDVINNILNGMHSIETGFLIAMLQEYLYDFWDIWKPRDKNILDIKSDLSFCLIQDFCTLWGQQFYNDGTLKSNADVPYLLTDFLLIINSIPLMSDNLYTDLKGSIYSIVDHIFWKHDVLDKVQKIKFHTDKPLSNHLWNLNLNWRSDTVRDDFLNYILVSAQNYIPIEYQQEVINIVYNSNYNIQELNTKHTIAIIMNLVFQLQ